VYEDAAAKYEGEFDFAQESIEAERQELEKVWASKWGGASNQVESSRLIGQGTNIQRVPQSPAKHGMRDH